MTNRSAISSFWFKVQDAGKDLGVTNDLIYIIIPKCACVFVHVLFENG